MKINFTQQLVDLKKESIGPLRDYATHALSVAVDGDDRRGGADKVKLWALAVRIMDADELDLPVEDVAMIKERIGRYYPPLVVGQAWAMLDPNVSP